MLGSIGVLESLEKFIPIRERSRRTIAANQFMVMSSVATPRARQGGGLPLPRGAERCQRGPRLFPISGKFHVGKSSD